MWKGRAVNDRMNTRGRMRRLLLLASASGVASDSGVGGLTHRAVAERSRVSLASVTYHFPTVADLRRETLEYVARSLGEAFDATLACPNGATVSQEETVDAEPDALRQAVSTLVGRWVQIGHSHRDDLRALMGFLAASLHDRELGPACEEALAVPVRILEAVGCPRQRARTLVSSLLGLSLVALLPDGGGEGEAVDQFESEAAFLVERFGVG